MTQKAFENMRCVSDVPLTPDMVSAKAVTSHSEKQPHKAVTLTEQKMAPAFQHVLPYDETVSANTVTAARTINTTVKQ